MKPIILTQYRLRAFDNAQWRLLAIDESNARLGAFAQRRYPDYQAAMAGAEECDKAHGWTDDSMIQTYVESIPTA